MLSVSSPQTVRHHQELLLVKRESIGQVKPELTLAITAIPGQQVHKECRQKYCNPQQIARAAKLGMEGAQSVADVGRQLRSAEKLFNFNSDCFFCGRPATFGKKRKSSDVVQVRTVEVRDTILAVYSERGDAWALDVQARLLNVHDLHAVYHRVCSVNFRTKKQIPAVHKHEMNTSKRAKVG